ncbi:hypothetical protein [Cohaesibacter celericrescens]|nr:hypothetical protein [Cohaesibacter celericrescens]
MMQRPSFYALALWGLLITLMFLVLMHGALSEGPMRLQLFRESLVRPLGLSDLALFTEARYTRHPSMADFHSAFQDHPTSLDHFPTGSLIAPPNHLLHREVRP